MRSIPGGGMAKHLTIITQHLAIYFLLHRGTLNENTARWQASRSGDFFIDRIDYGQL
jgi:hypothetical protein